MESIHKYKEKYKKDFPDEGDFNWVTVKINTLDKLSYHGSKINGVLLHDGKFVVNSVLFDVHEFDVIDYNPIEKLWGTDMMRITKIDYNWFPTSDGEISGSDYDTYEIGKGDVIDIVEHIPTIAGDVRFYDVFFKKRRKERIFNPNRVYYKDQENEKDNE